MAPSPAAGRHNLLGLQIDHRRYQQQCTFAPQVSSQTPIPAGHTSPPPSSQDTGSHIGLDQGSPRATHQYQQLLAPGLGHSTRGLRSLQSPAPGPSPNTTASPSLPPRYTPSVHRSKHVVRQPPQRPPTHLLTDYPQAGHNDPQLSGE